MVSFLFILFLKIICFCFVADVCDLVHDVEAIFHLLGCKQHLKIFSDI